MGKDDLLQINFIAERIWKQQKKQTESSFFL